MQSTFNYYMSQTFSGKSNMKGGFVFQNLLMIFVFLISVYNTLQQIQFVEKNTVVDNNLMEDESKLKYQKPSSNNNGTNKIHIVNSIIFELVFLVYIIITFISIFNTVTDNINDNSIKIVEFIFAIASIVFCISSLILFVIYLKNKKSSSDLKTEDVVGLICAEILLIYLINNLLYHNIIANLVVELLCLIIFAIISIILSIKAPAIICSSWIVLLFSVQLYNTVAVADAYQSKDSSLIVDNGQVAQLSAQIAQLSNQIQSLNTENNALTALNDALASGNQILIEQSITTLLNSISNNVEALMGQSNYLSKILSIFEGFDTILHNFYVLHPNDGAFNSANNFFFGYTPMVQDLKNQVNLLIAQGNALITAINSNNINEVDITAFSTALYNLIQNPDFIRCQIFFDQPTYTQDCGQFNIVYEYAVKLFDHFFRNWGIRGLQIYGHSNEQVLRDLILFAKTDSDTYNNGLSIRSRPIVDELYNLIDGAGIMTVLNGNIANDNSDAIDAQIKNQTSYTSIYADNGVQYITLVAQLAADPTFFAWFDWDSDESVFDWHSVINLVSSLKLCQTPFMGFEIH